MRYKIIDQLADEYGKEKEYVESLLKNYNKIPRYNTKVIKGRCVIDKLDLTDDEKIILEYYKHLINNFYGVKFPNRSYIMTELMNIIPYLHLYNSYTIYKFDLKEFFYNIDPKKSFIHLYESINLKPIEFNYLRKYSHELEILTPGVGLHNSLVEVSGKKFDFEIRKAFKERGLLYYCRYVDDCILILDEKVDRLSIEGIIMKNLVHCFGKRIKLNYDKSQYFDSESTNYDIDYLGYVFQKGQSKKQQYKFGIAKKKLEKYTKKIDNIILEYKYSHDINLLSFRLELFFKRIVYYGVKKSGKPRWQVRGISDSYKELKRFMKNNEDFEYITKETKQLFEKSIRISFVNHDTTIPSKIENQLKNKKFITCFLNNKALLLHKKIGLSHIDLKNKLALVDKGNLENDSYNELASRLLKKI